MGKHIVLFCLLSAMFPKYAEQKPSKDLNLTKNFLQWKLRNYFHHSVNSLEKFFPLQHRIDSEIDSQNHLKTKSMKVAIRRLFIQEKQGKGLFKIDRKEFQGLTKQICQEIKEKKRLKKENQSNKYVTDLGRLFKMEKIWFNRMN